jgi:hypothetical protein
VAAASFPDKSLEVYAVSVASTGRIFRSKPDEKTQKSPASDACRAF